MGREGGGNMPAGSALVAGAVELLGFDMAVV